VTINPDEESSARAEDVDFESFFRTHCGPLLQRLIRRLRNPDDAHDVAQEAFTKILELDRLKFIQQPLAYLWTTAVRAHQKLVTRSRLEQITYNSDAADQASEHPEHVPENDLMDEINAERHLLTAICELPPTHQDVISLYIQDLSVPQIAQQLGISEHTARKYITQAKAKIRLISEQLAKRESEGL
jgi:RNA polymerase sigma factor (sigma-70 family)